MSLKVSKIYTDQPAQPKALCNCENERRGPKLTTRLAVSLWRSRPSPWPKDLLWPWRYGVCPLIRKVATQTTTQSWYADDAIARGQLTGLRTWLDRLETEGPDYGYELNPPKSWLFVKPAKLSEEQKSCSQARGSDN